MELGYAPAYRIHAGLEATVPWYVQGHRKTNSFERTAVAG
jgi:dTDP-D-glucose 4,6-dehydratase